MFNNSVALFNFAKYREYMEKKKNNNRSVYDEIWVRIQTLLRSPNFQNSQNYVISKKILNNIEAKTYANKAYIFTKKFKNVMFVLIIIAIFTKNLWGLLLIPFVILGIDKFVVFWLSYIIFYFLAINSTNKVYYFHNLLFGNKTTFGIIKINNSLYIVGKYVLDTA